MNDRQFKRAWEAQKPPVPAAFHRAVTDALDQICAAEAAPAPRHLWQGGLRVAVIALIALLALGAAAIAAREWSLYQDLRFMLGTPSPGADSVMTEGLYRETVNGVVITVDEAGYDGRTLLVRYTYHLPAGEEPLNADSAWAYGVGWWADTLWINGQSIEIPADSGAVPTIDQAARTISESQYWRLDHEGIALNGKVQVALPIGAARTSEERAALYDRETGRYALPEAGTVAFTVDAKDTLARVVTEHPDSVTVLPEVTARVAEAAYTPLMTYITLDLAADPQAFAAYVAENGPGFRGEDGTIWWYYDGHEVFEEWLVSLRLVDGSGLPLDLSSNINGYGGTMAEFLYPALDPLPDTLWLAPLNVDGTADLSRGIRVR